MAGRVFAGDEQRQLERVFEAELGQLPRSGQGGDHVPPLIAFLKIPYEWPCEVDVPPPPGPGRPVLERS